MKIKIFKNIFLASMAVIVLCLILVGGITHTYFAKQYNMQVKNEAEYISVSVEKNGIDVVGEVDNDGDLRVTLVAPDGKVLFDNMTDASKMENHKNRTEIAEALKTGRGESYRYSDTLSEKTENYAIRLKDGNVLRVSSTQYTPVRLLAEMIFPITLVLIAATVLSLILASSLSKRITDPINRIDLENPDDRDVYEELKPFVKRIRTQNVQIQEQMEHIRDEHERQDAMRREFTANVSHELKTPLTSISGFAEIIRDGLVKPEDIGHFADTIYEEAQRLILLVGDIIKLSRLEDNDVVIPEGPVDLYDVCENTIHHLKAAAEKKKVCFHLSGKHARITGAMQIIDEIVYNLCDNAIKYNIEDGIVKITVLETDSSAAVEVSDTGIGIPQEDIDRVFERFYRVNKSHSKEVGGTGLGLSIVKHGVAYHKGKIEITSKEGKGTTVRVTFPNVLPDKSTE